MAAVDLLLVGVAAFLLLVPLSVVAGRSAAASPMLYLGVATLSALALAVAGAWLLADPGAGPGLTLPLGLPWLGAHFRIDALSAFFLVLVNLGGVLAGLYGLGQSGHEPAPRRVLPFVPLFLAGMNLVVLADDAFTFLLCWEVMSLASWALVMAHHHEPANRRAGHLYILMAGFGTAALLLAFGLLAGAGGGYGFGAMRAAEPGTATAILIMVLALVGTGSKAGLVPLHAWLPLAHPAAPSHVSALMSGVMTKVAVYGFIRIVFDLLDRPDWRFAMAVLVLGAASALFGVLTAILQRDLKRVLACSTIENIGFIFVGLGLALAFQANGMPLAAALAMTAALLHALNHSLFKTLLFFGAGAVLNATGSRDLDRLGGLLHRMPATGFLFLAGCVAIAALPPLNGFVSEWLTLQAILHSPDLPQWGLKILLPAVGGLLAMAAALVAACFVRAFGIGFLGRPRSAEAAAAHECGRVTLAAMALPAVLCLLLGILPGFAIDALAPVPELLLGGRMPVQVQGGWMSIVPLADSRSSYDGLLLFLFLAAAGLASAFLLRRLAPGGVRRAQAWGCGFADPVADAQYSAASFAQPLRRALGTSLLRAEEAVDMPPPGDSRPARHVATWRDPAWELLYAPLQRGVGAIADRLNRFQFLTIRRYLGLVFLALVALLVVLALWG